MTDSSATALLRQLPSVDELIRDARLNEVRRRRAGQPLVEVVRKSIARLRSRILDGESLTPSQIDDHLIQMVIQASKTRDGQSIRRVINATGVLLHTNLGRAPLASVVGERVQQAVGYCNVELDLGTGRRSKRGESVSRLIAELVGAEDAVVVNNCAAATILVLHAIASGRQVIVSRGQLVEIGGGFRLPEVFAAAGVVLREIGTTNRTYVRDYEKAMGDETGAIIKVHRGNFTQAGFVTQPTIEELVKCDHPEHVPVIDDVGSGCLYSLGQLGFDEPNVIQSVALGADLTLFSGDKLFGGPQCGIVVGKKRWIDQLRQSPMMRAMRIDKLTLAALQGTVEIHMAGKAMEELPLLRMIQRDAADIQSDCEALVQSVTHAFGEQAGDAGVQLKVVSCESQIGGGALPGGRLESFAVCLEVPHGQSLADRLRAGTPAIQVRLSENQLLLDLRTLLPDQLNELTECLTAALKEHAKQQGFRSGNGGDAQ